MWLNDRKSVVEPKCRESNTNLSFRPLDPIEVAL